MSETFILLGKGIPSIVQRNYSLPGTRLTASEAREYASRLLALADELDPADPPASDEAFDPEAFCALFDAALAEAHRAALAGELRDQKPLVAVDRYVEGIGYALDAARRDRDAARDTLRELIDYATENADSDNFMAINQLVKIAKRGLNDDHE